MTRDHRVHIAEAAERSLKDHVVVGCDVPNAWRCHNPKSWGYWFYVAELPGAIVQYGDVGGLLIDQGKPYDLNWLMGAIDSMDYVLGKASRAKRDYFVEEQFKAYVAEQGKDPDDFECYDDYVMQTGDSEGYESCHDWPVDTLWAYWALHRFCELRRAG